jgi:hypothetical protein
LTPARGGDCSGLISSVIIRSMTRRRLWTTFCIVQLLGVIGATVGLMWNFYFAIAGMVMLLPGYLMAYAFLHKVSAVAIWVPLAGLAIAIPVNAAFWYAYSRKSSID